MFAKPNRARVLSFFALLWVIFKVVAALPQSIECIQQLITLMYISVVPLFSCLLSEVRMSDGALPCHWSSTPGQQVFELANSWLESFIWLLNLLQAWYCSCGRRHSTLSLVLEGFKVKGEFGEEERRITNTGIKQWIQLCSGDSCDMDLGYQRNRCPRSACQTK